MPEYRITVQRKVPNTNTIWEKVFAIHGEADTPEDALMRAAVAKRGHPAGKKTPANDLHAAAQRARGRAQGAPIPDPEGKIRYPDITVRLSSAVSGNAFAIIGVVRQALKRAHVVPTEISQFSKEATGGGLDKKVDGYDNVLLTCMKWVNVV